MRYWNMATLTAGQERLMPGIYALAVLFLALLALPAPARAGDFPDDVKRTFTTDIPHFFQDDIPCTFGGKPTSGTKSSCPGPNHPAAAPHKATTHKKKRGATKQQASKPASKPTTSKPPPDQASTGANAGATAGTPADSGPAAR
jgi:hypothetical protein